jgi:2-polyprenyl-3-methyl-5-hydroxy-6-metoxy-1,4-benzoquinol methylase
MTIECPLCRSMNNASVESLEPHLLSRLYKTRLGINLSEINGHQIELRACSSCDLKFYHPIVAGGESFYDSLQRFEWYYLAEKEEYDIAAQHVMEGDSVLEIGGGYGAFATRIKTKSYMGLELSDSAVAVARCRGLSVRKDSIEEYCKEHEAEYDVVCSFQVLEHVANPRSFIEASLRCLKPGGKLIQSVPSENSFLGKEINNILNMPPHHMTRWTDTALLKLAELFGLAVGELRHDTLADYHIPPYVVSQVRNSLNNFFGLEHRSLDAKFATLFARAATKGLSLFPEMYLRLKQLRPTGHSVTAIYVKT